MVQPRIRLLAVGFGGLDQAVEVSTRHRAFGRIAEQPVLPSDDEGPDRTLGGVICSGQLIPDTTLRFFLVLSGCQSIIELVWRNPVVTMHQIMTEIPLSLLGRHVAHGRYPLSFQTAEYTLHRRVVVAITSATHALAYAVSPKPLAKLSAPILGAQIEVKQQALRLAALLISDVQRLDHQVRIRLVRKRPTHNPTRIKIHNHCQVMPFPCAQT
ncbi:hypothetical protein SAMN03159304_05215 [Pseudomonas sp. NFACC24-1]|nr:hypothetical protein SAMN03159304_05215 [Pseudomonas sp. NFACC24-1]